MKFFLQYRVKFPGDYKLLYEDTVVDFWIKEVDQLVTLLGDDLASINMGGGG